MPFDCIHLSAEETPPTAEDAIDDPKANRNEKGKEEGLVPSLSLVAWELQKFPILLFGNQGNF